MKKKFGWLTLIKYKGRNKWYIQLWLCKCKCGSKKIYYLNNLKNGHTKSCGCLEKKYPNNKIHGMKKTRHYRIWCKIKLRCLNKNYHETKYYKARGIILDGKWLNYKNFYSDTYKSYKKHIVKFGEQNTQIDRINNEIGYCPNNIRWATIKENVRNRRNTLKLNYQHKILPLAEWAEKYNLKYHTLWQRIYKQKLTIQQALK